MPNANETLAAIPFGSLIGGPLTAAIEAQGAAAMSSVNFIKAVGFDKDGHVNNISFTAKKGDQSVEITVPLLTIVPIPFIRIDDMTINFKTNITQSEQTEDKSSSSLVSSASLEGSVRYLFFSAKLSGSISSKKDSSSTKDSKYSVEHTVDVSVHAVQDDMPAGLARMLSILTKSIDDAGTPAASGKGGKGTGKSGGE